MTRLLSCAQLGEYRREGVVFPLFALSAVEAARCRSACDELETRLGGKPRTVEVRQMHLHFPWAYELATQPRILDAAEDVLGPNLLIWTTELFAKHPQDARVAIGWHRDEPYMGFDGGQTTTAWIALTDSTAANGCMRVVPASRDVSRAGVNGRPPQDPTGALDVVLRAGEMSLHDVHVLHGSSPNLSREKRVGFVVRFVTPESRPRHGRPPAILVRGEDRHGHFALIEPPRDTDIDTAITRLKESAGRHLDAMLHNLRHA
jgi:Phytanoyl-CoA dioxygenase (PhyH)